MQQSEWPFKTCYIEVTLKTCYTKDVISCESIYINLQNSKLIHRDSTLVCKDMRKGSLEMVANDKRLSFWSGGNILK